MDVYNLVRIVFMIHGRAESQKKKKKEHNDDAAVCFDSFLFFTALSVFWL